MPDILNKYLEKIKEFWNKYDSKQKTIFISSVLVAVIMLVILGVVVAKPQYIAVRYCSSAAEAVEVRELLTSNGITCTVGSNQEILINEEDEIEAKLVLGSNNISSTGYSPKDALSGGFSTTESDKEKLYQDYLEKKFATDLENIDGIKKAQITIHFDSTGSTIFTENKNASITAILTTSKELSNETIEGIALLLTNNVGNNNMNNVTIMNNKGELLFSGLTDSTTGAFSAKKFQSQLIANMKVGVAELILGTHLFSEVKVVPNLDFNEDSVKQVVQEYHAPDGTEMGLYAESYEVNSTGTYGAGGVAGTESNDDDTDVLLQNGGDGNSEYSLKQYTWLQNITTTTTEKAVGTINLDTSSISATLVKYNVISEQDLRLQGLLEDITYEEYKLANSDPVVMEIDPNLVTLIANGTGINRNRIALVAYSVNMFLDPEEPETSTSFIIQIILAVFIAALLLFVVFRSSRPVTVSETEPEVSVEAMLATTREQQQQVPLSDIDLQDKSEARKAIEKFVVENPEAVALLLRNWLNEGWD